MNDVWGYVIDGLFVTFLVSIIGGIAAASSSFNSLLFAMFGGTAETQLAAISYSWKTNLTSAIGKGAETLYKVTDASAVLSARHVHNNIRTVHWSSAWCCCVCDDINIRRKNSSSASESSSSASEACLNGGDMNASRRVGLCG